MGVKGSGRKSVIRTLEDEIYNFLYLYRWAYGAHLEEDLERDPKLAEERLVKLQKKEYMSCPRTWNLNPSSLYTLYAGKKGRPKCIPYAVLKGIGITSFFPGITEERIVREMEANRGENRRISLSLEQIRAIVTEFYEERKFPGRKIGSLAVEELLSPTEGQMLSMGRGMKSGSMNTAFSYYERNDPGTLFLFAVLRDLGIAEKLGITEQMAREAISMKMSRSISSALQEKKRIVVVDVKYVPAHVPETRVLPPLLEAAEMGPTTKIEIVLSTEVFLPRQKIEGEMTPPLIDQAIYAFLGNLQIVRAENARPALDGLEAGSVVVIKSKLPLDGIYQEVIPLLGWQVLDLNLQFRTRNTRIDSSLKGWRATRVRRETQVHLDPSRIGIYFQNQLYPLREAAHEIGLHLRDAMKAKTHYKMHLCVESAIMTLNRMRWERLIDKAVYNDLFERIKKREAELEESLAPKREHDWLSQVDFTRARAKVASFFMLSRINPESRARLQRANQRVLLAARAH